MTKTVSLVVIPPPLVMFTKMALMAIIRFYRSWALQIGICGMQNISLPYWSETWPQNAELTIMPKKTTVVKKACLYWLTPHSQCKAGDKMLKIMTSMESAIQQRPVTKLRIIWNFPNPNALTACVTVNESSGTTPEAAAEIWISAPEIQLTRFYDRKSKHQSSVHHVV